MLIVLFITLVSSSEVRVVSGECVIPVDLKIAHLTLIFGYCWMDWKTSLRHQRVFQSLKSCMNWTPLQNLYPVDYVCFPLLTSKLRHLQNTSLITAIRQTELDMCRSVIGRNITCTAECCLCINCAKRNKRKALNNLIPISINKVFLNTAYNLEILRPDLNNDDQFVNNESQLLQGAIKLVLILGAQMIPTATQM